MAEYSEEERRELLRLARAAIAAALRGERFAPPAPGPHLSEKRGAFTTLHCQGRLRGCIGYVEAREPLYRTVIETAQAAAFEDPRFQPLSPEEMPDVKLEISVMSPLQEIAPADVQVGVHGLLLSQHGRRGLLLPQVATEWGFSREDFLRETCRKAGLPNDAWQHGARIEAFTAEVFGEP